MITVRNKKDCSGCHACFSICPTNCILMKSDNEGFLYPEVLQNDCTKCGLCIKTCPILNKTIAKNQPETYACFNKDEYIRLESSSGGIFSPIAEKVISSGGVVFGAVFNKNFEVEHFSVETKNEISKLRGSKYVQSRIGDTFKKVEELLKLEKQVLFSGTPCQIAGLISFLGQPYEKLICIDFICHGVPSPDIWKKYFRYQEEAAGSKIKTVSFRSKDSGWKKFSMSILFENKTKYINTLDKDLYLRAFLQDLCLRPSCYYCNFKSLSRQSDITLADFWGVGNIFPEIDDDKGVSLVLINSETGENFLKEINSLISYRKVDISNALEYNMSAVRSAKINSKRTKFFDEKDTKRIDKLIKSLCKDSIKTSLKNIIKKIFRYFS